MCSGWQQTSPKLRQARYLRQMQGPAGQECPLREAGSQSDLLRVSRMQRQIVVLDPLGPSLEAGLTFTDKGTPRWVALVRWKSLYLIYC